MKLQSDRGEDRGIHVKAIYACDCILRVTESSYCVELVTCIDREVTNVKMRPISQPEEMNFLHGKHCPSLLKLTMHL
jgi:hypothetical protein